MVIIGARWNGLPCEAELGTVKCGKSPKPTWGCAALEGQMLEAVRVQAESQVFFLEAESGLTKVRNGGGPQLRHRSVPVDDPQTFSPREPEKKAGHILVTLLGGPLHAHRYWCEESVLGAAIPWEIPYLVEEPAFPGDPNPVRKQYTAYYCSKPEEREVACYLRHTLKMDASFISRIISD